MPWIAFVDEKVFKELEKINKKSKNKKESLFPEHDFLLSCLKIGLKLEDLKILTYIDVLKILISFCDEDEETEQKGARQATQEEIQKLVARM